MREFHSFKIIFLISLFLAVGCNNTSFSGSTTEKKKNATGVDAAGQNGSDPNNPNGEGLPGNGDGSANGEGVFGDKNGNNTGNPIGELVDNGDGTVSEQFFGLATVKSTVKVDVIIAMDTSGSMTDEKRKLEENMKNFLTKFDKTPGVDHQVFMIGRNFNFPQLDSNRFDHIDQYVDSRDSLRRIQDFLNGNYNSKLSLRADTAKELLIVTDDDSNLGADAFKTFLENKEAQYGVFHVNGFVWVNGNNNNGLSWCTRARDGNVYTALGNDAKFGGLVQHLCTEDWSKMLTDLAEQIIDVNAQVEFKLTAKVDPNDVMIVYINDQEIPTSGWEFNAPNNSIIFADGWEPQPGDNMIVRYSTLQ